MEKYAVVTFLFNRYDLLREPLIIDENADYYCLTDDKELKSKNWKCIYISEFDTDKLLPLYETLSSKYNNQGIKPKLDKNIFEQKYLIIFNTSFY